MIHGAFRCAIYTRKSTEEGLDQQFNSLDAQREACAAYIASQRHEGWRALPKRYDDGGYSGGNVQRPALQQLLADIAAGQVDLVVVYKIDRLTRSLTDFAKMVEVFDKHSTSFVSVTQHFNTTTSMGRLTLNVLLSFAQFEREVTGERIRDKIAASKRKGMWMGGPVPLGYDVKDRALMINAKEAETVRLIFRRYATLGCVRKLKDELDAEKVRSKVRISRAGNRTGGASLSRGALYLLLRNRLYRGEVHHGGKHHPGLHEPIVAKELWDSVQSKLDTNLRSHHVKEKANVPSLLAGMVYSEAGVRLTATHTVKNGRRHRYYWLRPIDGSPLQAPMSIPAHDLERLVEAEWIALLSTKDLDRQLGVDQGEGPRLLRKAAKALANDWKSLSTAEKRVQLLNSGLHVSVRPDAITLVIAQELLCGHLLGTEQPGDSSDRSTRLTRKVEAKFLRVGSEKRVLEDQPSAINNATAEARERLLSAIALGRKWICELENGEIGSLRELAEREKRTESYLYDVLRAACLAPYIVRSLIDGSAMPTAGMAIFQRDFPADWKQQAALFLP